VAIREQRRCKLILLRSSREFPRGLSFKTSSEPFGESAQTLADFADASANSA